MEAINRSNKWINGKKRMSKWIYIYVLLQKKKDTRMHFPQLLIKDFFS